MERLPVSIENLKKYIGKEVSEESFLSRGYFFQKGGELAICPYMTVEDLDIFESVPDLGAPNSEDDDINCRIVKQYLASEVGKYYPSCWVKCIPACPEDVDYREVYIILCINMAQKNGKTLISGIKVLVREVEQLFGGFVSFPGNSTIDSYIYEMDSYVTPEAIAEFDMLIKGRGLKKGFSLLGKPMPQDKATFHCNPPYSIAQNSAYRNIYWHLSIHVDDKDVIKSLYYSTYEREGSMMARPEEMTDDAVEAFDSILMIADCYSDKEWQDLFR